MARTITHSSVLSEQHAGADLEDDRSDEEARDAKSGESNAKAEGNVSHSLDDGNDATPAVVSTPQHHIPDLGASFMSLACQIYFGFRKRGIAEPQMAAGSKRRTNGIMITV